jgi:hypothetical protein
MWAAGGAVLLRGQPPGKKRASQGLRAGPARADQVTNRTLHTGLCAYAQDGDPAPSGK